MLKKLLCAFCCMILTVLGMAACSSPQSMLASTPSLSAEESSSSGNTMDLQQIKNLLKTRISEGEQLMNKFYLTPSLPSDENDTLTGKDTAFHRVTDSTINSLEAIRMETEKVYTPQAAQTLFYSLYFEGEYPLYKADDEGHLYINTEMGGRGYGRSWLTDTASIVNQTEDTIVVEMECTLLGTPDGKSQLELKKIQDVWLLNSSLDV